MAKAMWKRRKWLWLGIAGGIAVMLVVLLLPRGGAPPQGGTPLAELEEEIVPAAGTQTPYGIPISWRNAPRFADWYDEIHLVPSAAETLRRALAPIVTPCCDDTQLVKCCCERTGQICNLVRSARGLAAWLIQREGFSAEATRAAVETWIKFAHRDYYLAVALKERGLPPSDYGLTTRGSCYRDECQLPLRQGGCGGMGMEVRI